MTAYATFARAATVEFSSAKADEYEAVVGGFDDTKLNAAYGMLPDWKSASDVT